MYESHNSIYLLTGVIIIHNINIINIPLHCTLLTYKEPKNVMFIYTVLSRSELILIF
jgi:hypothetical protein